MSDDANEETTSKPSMPAMIASLPVFMPQSAEDSLRVLYHFFPMVDWRNLALVRLRASDGQELLALPAPIMEQLLTQVVGLCTVLSHDGPAH